MQENKRSSRTRNMGSQRPNFFKFSSAISLERDLKDTTDSAKIEREETIQESIVVEICSAWGLKYKRSDKSDPYVMVLLGNKKIHKTKNLPNTPDPIWTVQNNSMFLLEDLTVKETESALTFKVRDLDILSLNEDIGECTVPVAEVLESDGQRNVKDLRNPSNDGEGESAGSLVLRFRKATDYDIRFMKALKSGTLTPDIMLPVSKHYNEVLLGHTKKKKRIRRESVTAKLFRTIDEKIEGGEKKNLLKPGPDPDDPEKDYMTVTEIEKSAFEPSRNWTEVGNGKLGRIFLEIIGCDHLQNEGIADAPDVYVSIAFEDNFMNTDVIYDKRKPRWLPWTNRAFIFHMGNALSSIRIGVMDYDVVLSDDPYGRVTIITPSNLRLNTEYLLKYKLLPDPNDESTITVRLRTDISTCRIMWASIRSFSMFSGKKFICVKRKDEFRALANAVEQPATNATLKNLQAALDELLSHMKALSYIGEALATVIFWRGTYHLNICCCECSFPVHSLMIFASTWYVVENPQYMPSLFVGLIAWILVGTMNFRQNNPNPWVKNLSYRAMLFALFGCGSGPASIDQLDEPTLEKIKISSDYWVELDKMYKEEAEKLKEFNIRRSSISELTKSDDIETKGVDISLNLLRQLDPVVEILQMICVQLRVARNIVTWEDNIIAFWITTTLFLISVIFIFIPWGIVILWTCRVVVFVFWGPQNWFLGKYFFKKADAEDSGDSQLSTLLDILLRKSQIPRERVLQFRGMAAILFGNYVKEIPFLRVDRFIDVPLPTSIAKPDNFDPQILKPKRRILGQNFELDIVPYLSSFRNDETERNKTPSNEVAPLLSDTTPQKYDAVN